MFSEECLYTALKFIFLLPRCMHAVGMWWV